MDVVLALVLASALSLDSLLIGASYGMRGISVPAPAKLIIGLVSAVFTAAAIWFGSIISGFLPAGIAKYAGIFFLAALGGFMLFEGIRKNSGSEVKPVKTGTILKLAIKSFGITIKIIRNPEDGDMDSSKSIDPVEALYLGAALSVDSFGAGLGSSMSGISASLIPLFVVICQLVFLSAGYFSGGKISGRFNINGKAGTIISGSLLILLAAVRAFF
ncbi:MAG: sporulation membrane protein YtaF [Oscillospiraceae bacterium]|jgi:putative sporulation protein YtaF|nr:sporulation membrane protein YtaF [Oscillospiraceae bacterium]